MKQHLGKYSLIVVILGIVGYLLISNIGFAINGKQVGTSQILDAGSLQLRQIITQDNEHTRTIMWNDKALHENSVLEYKAAGQDKVQTVPASVQKFAEDNEVSYIYTAMLKDLEQGTQYEYRIEYEGAQSNWYSFTTAAKGNFKALVFPDSQSSDYTDWAQLVQTARKQNPNSQFFINMGDLVDNGEDSSQWRAWFSAVQDMSQAIPFAPVQGNHETYDLQWKVREPLSYLHYFALPANGHDSDQNQYYSFDYGDVHFVVLNTQMEELAAFEPNLTARQIAWLENDLQTTKQPWKIVLMHKDVLQYRIASRPERQEGISEVGSIFMPIFDKYKVDAVLSAHLHTYRRRGHITDSRRDERGTLYILTGVAGNVRYPNLWTAHQLDEFVAPQPETNNYMTLERIDNKLRFTSYFANGKQMDFVEISK